jgi:hypothetical protein
MNGNLMILTQTNLVQLVAKKKRETKMFLM